MEQVKQEYRDALDSLRFSAGEKERIMKNLMERRRQASMKRRGVRPLRTVLIAAALAVVCALMLAAAGPARIFDLVSGASASFQQVTEYRSVVEISGEMPLAMEDGRLWLVIRGERTDVTDLIDADTPYVYDNTDPDTGRGDYLVVGGTLADYGWQEFHELDDGTFVSAGANANNTYCVIDGVTYDLIRDLTDEQRAQVDEQIEKGLLDPDSIYCVWKPWYLNAADRLTGLDARLSPLMPAISR